ncbi:putative parvulin-type peptidyl-prolyl cis-trans isomerase [Pseudoprimorskyibacter insulae]|uniref:Parvulin-like PPIase n=2 Tax=Pseudoprimorskyibacter insulae TaxID=1695997 RepID=A0A2R8AU33_9RHOB|nr:putative parvulin-type peptidyl-prolyl cis-trans isomerase [Pseudoprimorskyibacter insulae]
MSKRLMKISAIACAMAFAAPAFAEDAPNANTVIATVNGADITLGHLILVRSTLPEQYDQLPAEVLYSGILDQLIQQELLSQDEKAVETLRVRLAVDNERRAAIASGVVDLVASEAVTDEALQAAYDAQYASAAMGTEYNASHILVETEEEAQAIVDELKAGADFAETAKAKSTGPSGPNGGELGWFGPGMMVEPFQAAVETLKPGEVSGPVQTQFGWHVIILNETRVQEAPSLDSVRAELANGVQQEAVKTYLDNLTGAANITRVTEDQIDTALIGNIQLLEE